MIRETRRERRNKVISLATREPLRGTDRALAAAGARLREAEAKVVALNPPVTPFRLDSFEKARICEDLEILTEHMSEGRLVGFASVGVLYDEKTDEFTIINGYSPSLGRRVFETLAALDILRDRFMREEVQ